MQLARVANADVAALEINNLHRLAQQTADTAVQHGIRCGQLLLDVKAGLRHGEFLSWVEKNCEFSGRSARAYMKAAIQIGRGLPISSLAKLLGSAAHVAHNSGENEWYTPGEIIEAARVTMGGIDVDPASTEIANRTVKAAQYFTVETDGLEQPWRGRVWMNPPYAQPRCAQFCAALLSNSQQGHLQQACVLVNNATETAWFQDLLSVSSAVCFLRGRVRFLDPAGNPGAPLQGQALLYLGDRAHAFASEFGAFGAVLFHG